MKMDCENCVRLSWDPGYNAEEKHSGFCVGYRTGDINGKEKSIEQVPEDVFVICNLIGAHSEDKGQHRFVFNLEDFYLELRSMFQALSKIGMLGRTIDRTISTIPSDIGGGVREGVKRSENHIVIKEGVIFDEYYCDCGQVFFREYIEEHEKYILSEKEKFLLKIHRDLDHEVRHRVKERIKDRPFWVELYDEKVKGDE